MTVNEKEAWEWLLNNACTDFLCQAICGLRHRGQITNELSDKMHSKAMHVVSQLPRKGRRASLGFYGTAYGYLLRAACCHRMINECES